MPEKKIPTFTVTLNFFVPDEVAENLKEVEVSGAIHFDWRNHHSAHCTVKSIYHGNEIPDEKVIDAWAAECRLILSQQKSFEVAVEGVEKWPTVLVSKVLSKEVLEIHRKLLSVLPSSQPQFDGENYCPHVSIVVGERVTAAVNEKRFGAFKVDEMQLMLWGLRDLKRPKVLSVYKLEN
jgi:2'-5' RNA ligase